MGRSAERCVVPCEEEWFFFLTDDDRKEISELEKDERFLFLSCQVRDEAPSSD